MRAYSFFLLLMQKLLLIPGVLGLVLLSACTANTPAVPTDDTDTSSSISVPSSDDQTDTDTRSSALVMDSSSSEAAQVRVIEVAVTNWSFSPNTIAIKKGEKVTIRLKGDDGTHSFGVTELGINVAVGPGETKDVVIPTDTAGTFNFRCMIPCGPGHDGMKGTIVIS